MTPAWRVVADGSDVTGRLRAVLDELRVTLTSDRDSDALELVASGPVAAALDSRELRVALGYGDRLTEMGVYTPASDELDLVPRRLTIRAAAADLGTRIRAPRTRAWDGVTLGEVAAAIAAEHDLEARVDPALAAEAIAHIDQTAESDLHLLRRIARHYDATVKVAGGRLVVLPTGAARSAGSGIRLPTLTIRPGQAGLIEGRVSRKRREAYASVRVRYPDPATGEFRHATAGTGEPVYEPREPAPDQARAMAAAAGHLRRQRRRGASLDATLVGSPAVVAETPVEMAGWGPPTDGAYVVTRARHVLRTGQGYTTEIAAEVME